ncbi:DNA-binding SARP family transcriptional activator [Thermopolyspora flexuosa]|uniref:DNA-binding SARP family transcriptional activator n=1 Tax=Thermopolyspora flexuosa TaxID=103836 RepID=A0A543J2R8_9ACTN|nr:BTAD domain-containing putative transcriptional regulator [Thermopolyspora flexuosa]TQM77127.1 DNA-binding SARP family transcriptional activator [Thermopolyspora flexuosa]
MRFRVLGPLTVTAADGREVPIGGNKLRVVLAGLLLRAGESVPVGRIASWLWEETDDPDRARGTVQSYINRLRRLPELRDLLVTVPDGYRVACDAGSLDLLRFRELTATAQAAIAAGDPAAATEALSAAVGLWRGPALSNVDSPTLHRDEVEPLTEEWLRAQEQWIDLGLDAGRHTELVPQLRELTRAHPLREPLWERLMLALYRSGRQAEALRAYHDLAELLADELGVDPGPALRNLHQAILTGDPALDPPAGPYPARRTAWPIGPDHPNPAETAQAAATPVSPTAAMPATPTPPVAPLTTALAVAPPVASPITAPAADVPLPQPVGAIPVPRQLRPDIPNFAGRRAELAVLDRLLEEALGDSPDASRPPVIVSVQGTAGVGKTALAVHWAHRVRDRFPDGQLYLDLRGYGQGRPVEPAAALETLLRALGTPADRVPVGVDERSALLRTLLAGRRVLLLLDNAGGSEQVAPLIPGSGGMVLVTSRNQLRALIVQYGARRVVLDQMPGDEAVELLAEVLGRDRIDSDPAAVAEIVERCARLPLALRIFAERAARFPDTPLRRLAAELRDERGRLTALDTGDGDDTDLRMVFSWTYRALDEAAARMFRLLGLHPGEEIGVGAAAALVGPETAPDEAAATRLLDRLAADHLLRSRSPGRYDFHDLLRAYAAECAREAGEVDEPLRRVLDWYLHTAHNAARHLPPGDRTVPAEPPPQEVTPLEFDRREDAVGWFETELANLMAAVRTAAAHGRYGHAWRIAAVLVLFRDFHVPGPAWADVHRIAADAARRDGRPQEEGRAINHLAEVHARLGELDAAVARNTEALALAREIGDRDLEGFVLADLGGVYFRLGEFEESTRCYNEALAIARERGDRRLEAETLEHIARNDNGLGRYEAALERARAALAIYDRMRDPYHQGEALRTIGIAQAGLGRLDEAACSFERALELMRRYEDRRGEAEVLDHLGRALLAAGDLAGARDRWNAALRIFTEYGDARAAALRERLREAGDAPVGDPAGLPKTRRA